MDKSQRRAIGGSCLGGTLGGVLGMILGGLIGYAMVEPQPVDERLPLTTGFIRLIGSVLQIGAVLVGAGIGGVVGAVGGSMLGAGLGVTLKRAEGQDSATELSTNDDPTGEI